MSIYSQVSKVPLEPKSSLLKTVSAAPISQNNLAEYFSDEETRKVESKKLLDPLHQHKNK